MCVHTYVFVCVCVCVCVCVWCVYVCGACMCVVCVCVCVRCVLIPLEVSFPNKVQLLVSVILCPLHSPFQGQAGMLPMEDMRKEERKGRVAEVIGEQSRREDKGQCQTGGRGEGGGGRTEELRAQ